MSVTKLYTSELSSDQTTKSTTWTDLDLSVSLDPGAPGWGVTLTLNVPNGFITGSNSPGYAFRILYKQGRGATNPSPVAFGQVTHQQSDDGRSPISVTRTVPHLDPEGGTYSVQWHVVRNNTAHLGESGSGPSATLTALVAPM